MKRENTIVDSRSTTDNLSRVLIIIFILFISIVGFSTIESKADQTIKTQTQTINTLMK